MKTNNNVSKKVWMCSSIFITVLLFCSFVVYKNICDLIYLLIFNYIKIIAYFNIKNENLE